VFSQGQLSIYSFVYLYCLCFCYQGNTTSQRHWEDFILSLSWKEHVRLVLFLFVVEFCQNSQGKSAEHKYFFWGSCLTIN
jgi:hypothetical protein